MNSFKQKYLKYKNKYLKEIYGGMSLDELISQLDANACSVENCFDKTLEDLNDPNCWSQKYCKEYTDNQGQIKPRYTRSDVICSSFTLHKNVYLAKDNKENKLVIWNELSFRDDLDTKRLLNELDILINLKSPYLINLLDFHRTDSDLILITEYAHYGDLISYLEYNPDLSFEAIKYIVHQVLLGIQVLHQNHLIHRDIKPENIVLIKNPDNLDRPIVKLIDFGNTTKLVNDDSIPSLLRQRSIDEKKTRGKFTLSGTGQFMAPEVTTENYDKSVDLYSLGQVLLFLITRLLNKKHVLLQVADKNNFYETYYNKELPRKVILAKEFEKLGYSAVIDKLIDYPADQIAWIMIFLISTLSEPQNRLNAEILLQNNFQENFKKNDFINLFVSPS